MDGRVFTVPNQLTFLRLGFLPFFIIFTYYERYGWALAILSAAAASDLLDGLLARALNQKSALGAYLDPIADKLLLSSSFFILAVKDRIEWWLTILVFSRDLLILIAAAVILAVVGYRPFPPSIYGKATTGAQIVFVFVAITSGAFETRWLDDLRDVGVFIVAAFTVLSGLHYSVLIARQLGGGNHPAGASGKKM
jgi:cardiolipin synthase